MGYTIAEKILAAHAGGQSVRAGDVVVASVDFAMLHDARASNALKMIAKLGVKSLPFAAKTALVLDHYSPPPNIEAAMCIATCARLPINTARCSTMSATASVIRFMPEGGHLTCGDLIVGTDTHSVTYGAFQRAGHWRRRYRSVGGDDDGQALVPRAGKPSASN